MEAAQVRSEIIKFDDEQRIVYGWASVATAKGETVVDSHGDVISISTLEKAATDFMLDLRVGKVMHFGAKAADIVHSLVISKSLAETLGIACEKEGWIIGMKVYDNDAWEKVKSGKYKAFSIGGLARRISQ